jgi:hypothetical protein
MGATAAAAVIIRKEKRIVEAFRSAGATSPGTAVSPEVLGVHQRIALVIGLMVLLVAALAMFARPR